MTNKAQLEAQGDPEVLVRHYRHRAQEAEDQGDHQAAYDYGCLAQKVLRRQGGDVHA